MFFDYFFAQLRLQKFFIYLSPSFFICIIYVRTGYVIIIIIIIIIMIIIKLIIIIPLYFGDEWHRRYSQFILEGHSVESMPPPHT